MRTRHVSLGIAAIVLAAMSAWAGKVRTWKQDTQSDFARGKFSQTVVSSLGTVQLGRELKELPKVEGQFVWDLALGAKGTVYVATGEGGRVYQISADGKLKLLADTGREHVFSLVARPDGTVYAGTGPDGVILKIAPDGKSNVFFNTGKKYVWDLALDSGGILYAATGTPAEVFRIEPNGKGTSLLVTKQKHMLSLALGSAGQLYVGTDSDGLIYRIERGGRAFVLYDAAEPEIRTLLVRADGRVYLGASSPAALLVPTLPTKKPVERPGDGPTGRPGTGLMEGGKASPGEKTDESEGLPAQTSWPSDPPPRGAPTLPTGPTTGAPAAGTSAVYRIDPDGSVLRLLQQGMLMLCLADGGGRLLVGAGQPARLFELDDSRPLPIVTSLARVDHGEILSLACRPDGTVVLGAGDPGRLYMLGSGYARKGTYESSVYDAGMISQWGAIEWDAEVPPGTKLTLAVRTGNVSKPDDTWSGWSAEMVDQRGSRVGAPAGRFAQFRATFETDDSAKTPELRVVRIRFGTANQSPVIKEIEVPDPAEADGASQLAKLNIKWTAEDPNKDDLRYQVWCRKEGWPDWIRLAKGLSKPEYEWSIAGAPEGRYQLRVVASDRMSNPAAKALEAELVSETIVVDHSAPRVRLRLIADKGPTLTVEVEAEDALTRIARAAYSIDSGTWQPIFPIDALFDSPRERLRFSLEGLEPGPHVLVLHVADAAGNVGTADLLLTVAEK